MNQVLQINNLHKKYGRIHAVNGLSMQVNQGEIFGILGPNGSGKTTTLGILLDVTNKTSGDFNWFGQPGSHKIRQKIGAILETPCFYPYLTGFANLEVVAAIKNVKKQRIDKVLKDVGLYDRRYDKFRTYSLGMKQRLAIAAALIPDPDVLILDEPTSGLDPNQLEDIRGLIKEIGREKTVMLSTHIMQEVEAICDRVIIIKNGDLVANERASDLQGRSDTQVLYVEFEGNVSRNQLAKVRTIQKVESVGANSFVLEATVEVDVRKTIAEYAKEKDLLILTLRREEKSLEEVFKSLTK